MKRKLLILPIENRPKLARKIISESNFLPSLEVKFIGPQICECNNYVTLFSLHDLPLGNEEQCCLQVTHFLQT